jgi:hypothetical protein
MFGLAHGAGLVTQEYAYARCMKIVPNAIICNMVKVVTHEGTEALVNTMLGKMGWKAIHDLATMDWNNAGTYLYDMIPTRSETFQSLQVLDFYYLGTLLGVNIATSQGLEQIWEYHPINKRLSMAIDAAAGIAVTAVTDMMYSHFYGEQTGDHLGHTPGAQDCANHLGQPLHP